VFVALAAIVTVMVVAVMSLFAMSASASPLARAQNAVGVIAHAAGQRVGAHEGIPAGQGRERAPAYDQTVVGSCVGVTAEGPIRWGPHNGPVPLDKITMPSGETVASTFRSGSYTQLTTTEDITLYHAYGGQSGPLSPFWTRTMPSGPLQAQLDLALNPAWGNSAEAVSAIRVPAGTEIFEGAAGPQGVAGGGSLLGGGSQVYVPWVNPDWMVP